MHRRMLSAAPGLSPAQLCLLSHDKHTVPKWCCMVPEGLLPKGMLPCLETIALKAAPA